MTLGDKERQKQLSCDDLQDPVKAVQILAEARERLTQELEANLKQLKTVIDESKSIADELKAVLKESRSCGDAREEKKSEKQAGGEGKRHERKNRRSNGRQDQDQQPDDQSDRQEPEPRAAGAAESDRGRMAGPPVPPPRADAQTAAGQGSQKRSLGWLITADDQADGDNQPVH